MRRLLAILLVLGLAQSAPAQTQRKNVIILIADDLGLDLGCYGHPVLKTPNLDRLAKSAVRFPRAYATVSSCSPSRASIYTGLFTHQNGQYGLQHGPHAQECHPWVVGLPTLLKRTGYFTGVIGKFHTGPASSFDFDFDQTKKVNARSPEAMTQKFREFVGQSGKKPFFAIMGYTDPHRAGKGFGNEPFKGESGEVVYDPKQMVVPPHLPDNDDVRRDLADYCQSASRMDRGIGLLIAALQELGEFENTLIFFISDNGIPFPGAKTTLYAAGVHLPLLVACPGQPRGGINNALASYIDITPTILDFAKAKGPSYTLPGRSLLPILGEENPKGWDQVFGSHQMHEITMYYPMRAITTRTHKYILNLDNKKEFPLPSDLWASPSWQSVRKGKLEMMGQRKTADFLYRPREELYDVTKDPHEMKNIAADSAHQEVLADLRQRVRAWQKETNDPWQILYRNEEAGFNK